MINLDAELLLRAGALFVTALIVFHLMFWRLFRWPADLRSTNYINQRVPQVMNWCLIFIFALFAWLSWFHASELTQSPLGRALLLGMAGLWWFRCALQPIYFGAQRASLVLLAVFACGGLLYSLAWWVSRTPGA